MRRHVAGLFVLPLLLLTAACGDDSSSDATDSDETTSSREGTISDVTVTGDVGEKPEIEFKAPITFATTESKVLNEGDGTGEEAKATSVLTITYTGVNASTGEEFDSSYGEDGKATPATFGLAKVIPGFQSGLIGAQAGDRVLMTINSKDGYDPTGSTDGVIKKGDSLVFVVDVLNVSTPLAEAKGTPKAAPANVPTLTLDKDGHPKKFVKTATTTKQPAELGVYPVIVGDGPKVEAGQTITVHYVGQIYPDGDVFDESWSKGEPVEFVIGQGAVIKGWDQALVGQTVGSRVIIVIPSDLGYGKEGNQGIPPNSDLIFAVDILSAS